jgi:hypothetical protein
MRPRPREFSRMPTLNNCVNADQALTQGPLIRGFSVAGITVLTLGDDGQTRVRNVLINADSRVVFYSSAGVKRSGGGEARIRSG